MLKKHNGIDTDYYLNKMDRGDVEKALMVSDITSEQFDWIFESDEPKKRRSVEYKKG